MSFDVALKHILRVEGGYVNDPDDRGGATNKGVTQANYDDWRDHQDLPCRPVKDITDDEVVAFYRERYWHAGKCDQLPEKLALVHMDACVNHGVGRASRMLQKAVGATVDGIVGPRTLGAARMMPETQAIDAYLGLRREFYAKIVERDETQAKFMRIWNRRLEQVREAIA